jgi:hypothetical protein
MSFLIRLWRDLDPQPTVLPDWQAEVEHIQSGEKRSFTTLESTLDFLRTRAQEAGPGASSEPDA